MNKRFDFDSRYLLKGAKFLIGADEAGRGPGAGPVFAAAVCFPYLNDEIKQQLENLNDSKQLTEKAREELFEIIAANSIYSVNQGSIENIERLNILKTSLLTMKKCIEETALKLQSEAITVLIDGNKKAPDLKYRQEALVKGDFKSASIAAASIIAKVSRDRFMLELHKEFPQYGWDKNKGYITKQHIEAVQKYGFTKWHRRSFFESVLQTQLKLGI